MSAAVPQRCDWHLTDVSGVPVARGSGEMTGMPVDCRLKLLAASESSCRLAVDLGGVTYLQSAAIGDLISVAVELRSQGGALAIVSPPGDVARLLRISGAGKLNGLLRIFSDVESAIAWLKSAEATA